MVQVGVLVANPSILISQLQEGRIIIISRQEVEPATKMSPEGSSCDVWGADLAGPA